MRVLSSLLTALIVLALSLPQPATAGKRKRNVAKPSVAVGAETCGPNLARRAVLQYGAATLLGISGAFAIQWGVQYLSDEEAALDIPEDESQNYPPATGFPLRDSWLLDVRRAQASVNGTVPRGFHPYFTKDPKADEFEVPGWDLTSAQRRTSQIFFMPEGHFCPQCMGRRGELFEGSRGGKYLLAREGQIFVAPSADQESPSLGIEDAYPLHLVGALFANTAAIRPFTVPADRANYLMTMSTLLLNPTGKKLWETDTLHAVRVACDDSENEELKALEAARVSGLKALHAELLQIHGKPLIRKVARQIALSAIDAGERMEFRVYDLDRALTRELLEKLTHAAPNAQTEADVKLNLEWREIWMARNVARAYLEAARRGKHLVVVVGTAHASRIAHRLAAQFARMDIHDIQLFIDVSNAGHPGCNKVGGAHSGT